MSTQATDDIYNTTSEERADDRVGDIPEYELSTAPPFTVVHEYRWRVGRIECWGMRQIDEFATSELRICAGRETTAGCEAWSTELRSADGKRLEADVLLKLSVRGRCGFDPGTKRSLS